MIPTAAFAQNQSAMSKSDYVPMVAPLDIGSVAYFIMFYEGMGNLFPWNAFITASSYYAQRFCGTSFEDTFENYFSITYTLSQTIGLGLAIVYGDRLTLNQKVSIPLAFYSTIFGITTMLVAIQDINPTLLFYVTLLSAFASGSCGALLSSGLFGLGAMLPPAYTGALMNGKVPSDAVCLWCWLLCLLLCLRVRGRRGLALFLRLGALGHGTLS